MALGCIIHLNTENKQNIMKKRDLSLLLCLLLISSISFSQIKWDNPLPVGADLRCVKFTDAQTGYAVGKYGAITKTIDGGVNWTDLNSSTRISLYGLCFTSSNTGYAVGDGGTVIKTTDAGANWTGLQTGVSNNLKAVYFIDEQTGFAVGASGTIIKTNDSGASWTIIKSKTTNLLTAVVFTSANQGYAIGDNATLLITSDSGANWTKKTLPKGHYSQDDLKAISFPSATVGYITGEYADVFKTNDGGISWTLLSGINFTSSTINSVSFIDEQTGYAVGKVWMKTVDGGANWTAIYGANTGLYSTLFGIYMIDSKTGFSVGNNGSVVKLSNGNSLTAYPADRLGTITKVKAASANSVFAINMSSILRSTDQGASWTSILPNEKGGYKADLCFIDENTGFLLTDKIYKTINSGKDWVALTTSVFSTYNYMFIAFANKDKGIIGGFNGEIKKTSDGGTTWSLSTTGFNTAFRSGTFKDENTCFAVGNGGQILKSIDGGANWTIRTIGTDDLYSIYFFDNNNAWITGGNGKLLRSTDGGNNWSTVNIGTNEWLYQSYFTSANIGYISGSNGSIFKTIDGGDTWTLINSDLPDPFTSFCFTDAKVGYFAGVHQNILKTTNGCAKILKASSTNLSFATPNQSTAIETIGSEMDWSMSSDQNWLSMNPSTGSASATVEVSVTENLLAKVRSGEITLTGSSGLPISIHVTQAAAVPKLQLTNAALRIAEASNSSQISEILSNTNWTVKSSVDWITLNKTAGTENETVVMTAQRNPTLIERIGLLTFAATGVADQVLTVTQEAGMDWVVSNLHLQIDATKGSSVNLDLLSLKPWTVTVSEAWLSSSLTSGAGNARLNFKASANPSQTARTAYAIFSAIGEDDLTVTITQDGAYFLSTSTNSISLPSLANSKTTISVSSNTQWTVSSNQAWLKTDKTTYLGNEKLSITLDANSDTEARTAILSITGKEINESISVDQDGDSKVITSAWTWQDALPQGNMLKSITFADANIGFAVGKFGTIVKTIDAGANWALEPSITTEHLNSVSFTNIQTGIAVGENGAILRTLNQGDSWYLLPSVTNSKLNGVDFGDDLTALAVGANGIILRTKDLGKTWSNITSGTSQDLQSIVFTNRYTAYTCGLGGIILKTTDGGLTWNNQNSGVSSPLYSIHFTSSSDGYAAGENGTIITTSNGGASWTSVQSPTTSKILSIYFEDSQYGYVGTLDGQIFKTSNSGTSWTQERNELRATVQSIRGTSAGVAYATGAGGAIVKKKATGDRAWRALSKGSQTGVKAIAFADKNTGCVVGNSGLIKTTTDGGATWPLTYSPFIFQYNSVIYTAPQTLHACGSSGFVAKSVNGGKDWTVIQNSDYRTNNSIFFTSPQIGYIAGETGTIRKTIDGGDGWSNCHTGIDVSLNAIAFTDADNGIAIGRFGTIVRTSDAGYSWVTVTSGTNEDLISLYFVNTKIGFAVGDNGVILKTTNGGKSWIVKNCGKSIHLNSVRFFDDNNGMIVGQNGAMYQTTNGGEQWFKLANATDNDLYACIKTDPNTVFVAGDFENILTSNSWNTNLFGLSTDALNLDADGKEQTVQIVANLAWHATVDQTWLHLSKVSSSGGETISITADPNQSYQSRVAYAYFYADGVSPLRLQITQDQIPNILDAAKKIYTVAALANSTVNVEVTSNTNWLVSSDQNWLSLNPSSQSGNGTFTCTANANTSIDQRYAILKLTGTKAADQTVTIVQDGAKPYLAIKTNDVWLDMDASAFNDILSNTSWKAKSKASWLSVAPEEGKGNKGIYLSGHYNARGMARSAVIVFSAPGTADETLTVSQAGQFPNLFSTSFSNVEVDETRKSSTIDITSNLDWAVSSDQTWVQLNKTKGADNGTIGYTVMENESASDRSATITVSGPNASPLVFTIKQAGHKPYLTIKTKDVWLDTAASAINKILSNTSWKAKSMASWLSVSPEEGSGNKSIHLSGSYNARGIARSAVIVFSASGVADETLTVSQVGQSPNLFSSNATKINVDAIGKTNTIDITSNLDWTVSCDQAWVKLDKTMVSDNGTIGYTVLENKSFSERSAIITVSTPNTSPLVFTIKQAGQAVYLTSDYDAFTLNGRSSSKLTIELKSNGNWKIVPQNSWVQVNPNTGTGDAVVNVAVETNTTAFVRQEKLNIYLSDFFIKAITITQSSGTPRLSADKAALNLDANGGVKSISVKSNAAWNASVEGANWLTIDKVSGKNDSVINVTVPKNTSLATRTGRIKITAEGANTIYIDVKQLDIVPFLNVGQTKLSAPSDGGQYSFVVNSNIAWTIQSDQNWVQFSKTSGSENQTVNITVSANDQSTVRNAVVTLSGIDVQSSSVAVTQNAAPIALHVNTNQISLASLANSRQSFTIQSNLNWTVTSNASWLSVETQSGKDNGTVAVTANANTKNSIRTTMLIISAAGVADQVITVSQDGITSVDEITSNMLRLYPNPTTDFLYLSSSVQGCKLSIWDITGKLIKHFPQSTEKIDVSDLNPGVYLIKVEDKTGVFISRFIKE